MYVRKGNGNTYYLEASAGTHLGKRQKFYKTVQANGKRELNREIRIFEAEIEEGVAKKKKTQITVYDLCEKMVNDVISLDAKETTLHGYRVILERLKQFDFANAKAESVLTADMQEFVTTLREARWGKNQKPYAPKTIKATISFMSTCYDLAIVAGLVSHNPCIGVRLPKADKKSGRALNLDELPVFLMNLDRLSPDIKVAFELALFLGMRRSEICGLRLEHIHDDYLDIKETRHLLIENGEHNEVVSDTKTEGSAAYIALPQFLKEDIDALIEYHKIQSDKYGELYEINDYLILAPNGTKINPGRINNILHDYVKEIGIENVTLHQLRHTYASLVNHFGADIVELASQMRHSNANVTLTVYTHMVKSVAESSKKWAEKMDEFQKQNVVKLS